MPRKRKYEEEVSEAEEVLPVARALDAQFEVLDDVSTVSSVSSGESSSSSDSSDSPEDHIQFLQAMLCWSIMSDDSFDRDMLMMFLTFHQAGYSSRYLLKTWMAVMRARSS